MPKRSFDTFAKTEDISRPPLWTSLPQAVPTPPIASPSRSHHSDQNPLSPKVKRPSNGAGVKAHKSPDDEGPRLPSISRKVKACAACRKQKIKCNMPGEPPCQRCKERGLSCRLNKSLQTLMAEDSRWKSSVTKDLAALHSSLDSVLTSLSLPSLPTPQVIAQEPAMFFDQDEQGNDDDEEESRDNSPKPSPMTENIGHAPIESLYQITGLRALRSQETVVEEQSRICKQLKDTDFISKGQVSIEDAEYLASFFLTKLDPFIYYLTGNYRDLDAFRRRSPTLTACILTIAALHDPSRSHLYPICNKEFKRLVANAMFEKRIDIEYLRALVVGSYWLTEVAWILSGYAVRRASEFHLRQCYYTIVDANKNPTKYTKEQCGNAMDGIRVMYLLYICDHHLSILYGRPSILRDNETYIFGWEEYLSCPQSGPADRRIASQLSLLLLMSQMRESFGPEDNASPLHPSDGTAIARFETKLDDWMSRWGKGTVHDKNIGSFPSKGIVTHYQFAKLYLESYVFRGLPENGGIIPECFLENASSAVAAAKSIITMLLEDPDLRFALCGVPHYFHGMVAFACEWMVKTATRYSTQLYVNLENVQSLVSALSQQLRRTQVGKDHLLNRMASGLEAMAASIRKTSSRSSQGPAPSPSAQNMGPPGNGRAGQHSPFHDQWNDDANE